MFGLLFQAPLASPQLTTNAFGDGLIALWEVDTALEEGQSFVRRMAVAFNDILFAFKASPIRAGLVIKRLRRMHQEILIYRNVFGRKRADANYDLLTQFVHDAVADLVSG